MKSVQVKYRNGTKWKLLPAKEMIGTSIADYMTTSNKHLIAAMFDGLPEDNKPLLFVVNNKEDVAKYQEKALTLLADDLKQLMGRSEYPSLYLDAVQVFDEHSPLYGTVTKE